MAFTLFVIAINKKDTVVFVVKFAIAIGETNTGFIAFAIAIIKTNMLF